VLSSPYVVFPLGAISAIALIVARRRMEAAVLVAGMALIVIIDPLIEDWVDRPRPPGGLVDVSGSGYPSAHAAYSTIYTWVAITLALRAIPGIARGGLVIAAGIAVSALLGLSRAYLRVQWMSDVSGGWALGVSCFAAAAIVALVINHIRQNARRNDRSRKRTRRAPAGARN
jgi:membrane-associated phospholipid phosphatase